MFTGETKSQRPSLATRNNQKVSPNIFRKKDSIESVDLNQKTSTIAKFMIVIGNTVL